MMNVKKILLPIAGLTLALGLSACNADEKANQAADTAKTTAEATAKPLKVASNETTTATNTASNTQTWIEGEHYTRLPQKLPNQTNDGKIEVIEFFWYGCPHCYNMEPIAKRYKASAPENVAFLQIPTYFPNWMFHARLYFIGQMLDPDGSKQVHDKIFAALHEQGRRIKNDDGMIRFFESLGIEENQVKEATSSTELENAMKNAAKMTQIAGLQSVPSFVVGGQFLTSPTMAKGQQKIIPLLNHLTDLVAQ